MATIERYETKKGALYAVRFRTPDNKQTMKRGFATMRDARDFANAVEVKKLRGEYIAPVAGKVTIGQLGPAWLNRQRGHLKPSSYRVRESRWRVYVKPRWENTRIADIKYSDVQAWVSDLATQRSASTAIAIYSVLAKILDDCVRDRTLIANPARGVKLPKRPPSRNTYLSESQLDMLADESGAYRSLVLLLGTCGLRWGEAAALKVNDIDFLRRRINLHANVTQGIDGKVVGTLKSNQNRAVVLPTFVADALAVTCEGKARDDLMWPSATGGYMSSGGSWLQTAVRRCQKIDSTFPRITAHDLRHTAASLAISAGANPKVVQRMLGHASAAMTLDVYAELFDSDLSTVADRLGEKWAAHRIARLNQFHD